MAPKAKAMLAALLVTIPLDQGTKWLVATQLTFADRVQVIENFFYITHVRNPGAAFGLFNDGPAEIRLPFFIGVSLVAVLIIASFYRRLAPGDRHASLTLGLILGGAIGNLVDRLVHGEVVDFLHFRLWSGYAWPDFNLADTFIVVGVGLLMLELLATEGGEPLDSTRAESET